MQVADRNAKANARRPECQNADPSKANPALPKLDQSAARKTRTSAVPAVRPRASARPNAPANKESPMKNLSRLSAMAITSALAATSAWAGGCAPKCRSKCAPTATRGAPKCIARCGARCGAKCGAAADPKLIKRPAGYRPHYPSGPDAVAAGGKLFRDTSLSTNGMSCASCHEGGKSYQASFAQPFPHKMAMASQTYGVKQLHLDEAIQVCMIGPMAARPLPWKSAELANLMAFMEAEHKKFSQ